MTLERLFELTLSGDTDAARELTRAASRRAERWHLLAALLHLPIEERLPWGLLCNTLEAALTAAPEELAEHASWLRDALRRQHPPQLRRLPQACLERALQGTHSPQLEIFPVLTLDAPAFTSPPSGAETLTRVLDAIADARPDYLSLSRWYLGDAGIDALLQHPTLLASLRGLDLSHNAITDAGLERLLTQPFPNLEALNLTRNHLTWRSLLALSAARELPALSRVGLTRNPNLDPMTERWAHIEIDSELDALRDGEPIQVGGVDWFLVDTLDILDLDDEERHAFTLHDVRDVYRSRYTNRYPNNHSVQDTGVSHEGGYTTFRVSGLTPGRPLAIVRRMDVSGTGYTLEYQVDGRSAGFCEAPERDRRFRWRNSAFEVPAALIQAPEVTITQRIHEPGYDVSMFHFWFFQPREPIPPPTPLLHTPPRPGFFQDVQLDLPSRVQRDILHPQLSTSPRSQTAWALWDQPAPVLQPITAHATATALPGAWQELSVAPELPERIDIDGVEWALLSTLDILDKDSEDQHGFSASGYRDHFRLRQRLRYPDGTVLTDTGIGHDGGVLSYQVSGLEPRQPLAIVRRTDWAHAEGPQRFVVDGVEVGTLDIPSSDRRYRWRNWTYIIPARSVRDTTITIQQHATDPQLTTYAFRFWFYQQQGAAPHDPLALLRRLFHLSL